MEVRPVFRYEQHSGKISHPDFGGVFAAGYAGADPDPTRKGEPGEGKNRHDMQAVKSIGPLPVGRYTIGPPEAGHGGFTLRLHPEPGNAMFGRDGFLIHGDSLEHPGQASQGCIILPRIIRAAIWGLGDRDLEVVP